MKNRWQFVSVSRKIHPNQYPKRLLLEAKHALMILNKIKAGSFYYGDTVGRRYFPVGAAKNKNIPTRATCKFD